MITIGVGSMTYSFKLKSKAGEYEELQKELTEYTNWARHAERLSAEHGGLESLKKRWFREYKEWMDKWRDGTL